MTDMVSQIEKIIIPEFLRIKQSERSLTNVIKNAFNQLDKLLLG